MSKSLVYVHLQDKSGKRAELLVVDATDAEIDLGKDIMLLVVSHGARVSVENYEGEAPERLIDPDDFYELALETVG